VAWIRKTLALDLIKLFTPAMREIWSEAIFEKTAQGLEDWVKCSVAMVSRIIKNADKRDTNQCNFQGNDCESHNHPVPIALYMVYYLYASLAGIVIFICFGTTDEVRR